MSLSYKTPWQLTLHVPAGDTAIKPNTPIVSDKERRRNGMRTFAFKETEAAAQLSCGVRRGSV